MQNKFNKNPVLKNLEELFFLISILPFMYCMRSFTKCLIKIGDTTNMIEKYTFVTSGYFDNLP